MTPQETDRAQESAEAPQPWDGDGQPAPIDIRKLDRLETTGDMCGSPNSG